MPRWPKKNPRPGVDAYGRTSLWNLAFASGLEGVRRELEAGADPNGGDDAGYTPLHNYGRSPLGVLAGVEGEIGSLIAERYGGGA